MNVGSPDHGPTPPRGHSSPWWVTRTVGVAWVAAAAAMLLVGWVFNQIEDAFPNIQAEYEGPGFRTWPGWTKRYMIAHPIWFGFVFAAGYVLVTRHRPVGGWVAAGCRGAGFGGLLFLLGSLPLLALVYASFRVSPELLVVSWAARNLAQYTIAGACVGLVLHGLTRHDADPFPRPASQW